MELERAVHEANRTYKARFSLETAAKSLRLFGSAPMDNTKLTNIQFMGAAEDINGVAFTTAEDEVLILTELGVQCEHYATAFIQTRPADSGAFVSQATQIESVPLIVGPSTDVRVAVGSPKKGAVAHVTLAGYVAQER